jgi:hypothetical protein
MSNEIAVIEPKSVVLRPCQQCAADCEVSKACPYCGATIEDKPLEGELLKPSENHVTIGGYVRGIRIPNIVVTWGTPITGVPDVLLPKRKI